MPINMMVIMISPSVRKIIRMAFPSPEFKVLELTKGKDVIKNLENAKPNVIFLDMSIKNPDGYEIAGVLNDHSSTKECPLFLFQRAYDTLDENKLTHIGYTSIIFQPFDSGALASHVRSLFPVDALETLPEEPVGETSLSKKEKKIDQKKLASSKIPDEWKKELKNEILAELQKGTKTRDAKETDKPSD